MNERKSSLFAVFFIGLAAGFVFGGIAIGKINFGGRAGEPAGGSAGEIAELNRRYDQLSREHAERQRVIEEQQRGVRDGVTECLGYVATARAIIERTGGNAGRAVGNLREAAELVKQGIEERKALEVELDNLRARLRGLGDLAGD